MKKILTRKTFFFMNQLPKLRRSFLKISLPLHLRRITNETKLDMSPIIEIVTRITPLNQNVTLLTHGFQSSNFSKQV